MPGTYISPAETGLYYLQSRYYAPELGRFINADAFTSTGQGFTGNNMFAYCGNNPVNRVDPTGTIWEIIPLIFIPLMLTACADDTEDKKTGYSSADAAATAFAVETYSASYYIIHEFSSVIYSTTTNGVTTYYYTDPHPYSPHSALLVPSTFDGQYVATVHTHPLGGGFSLGDKKVAQDNNIQLYVADVDHNIFHYSGITRKTRLVGTFTPDALGSLEKTVLPIVFQNSWDTHFDFGTRCTYGCENRTWPRS